MSSGGLELHKPISKRLGIDADFANYFHSKNGILNLERLAVN